MIKAGIDQDALIKLFAETSAKNGEAVRTAVRDATVRALQQRELTMENIKRVVQTVTAAASAGTAKNTGGPAAFEAMLGEALAGMDSALMQAVEANHKALQQFVDHGAAQDKQFKAAMTQIEKMEESFFSAVGKAAQSAGISALQQPWNQALTALKSKGSETGSQATQVVEDLTAQAHEALRQGRAITARAAQTMLEGYAAVVRGVLIGMSEGMSQGGAGKKS
ncbi:MAG TPA: DUF6781 family protein [Burkholderiaceae bacterium]|nr:DUF6781 family protein [Burkholderiaceae bacterium]